MEAFSRDADGVAAAAIVSARNSEAWVASAVAGDPMAGATLSAITRWAEAAGSRGLPAKCIGCDTEFIDGATPDGFAVLMALNPISAIVTGICSSCANRASHDELLETAAQQWRRIWPGLYPLAEGGHA
jgi:hypothetical protein